MVDTANLGVKVASYRRTGGHIGLHDVTDYLDRITILENRRIIRGLRDYCVPLHGTVSILTCEKGPKERTA